ncbi:hypothetical protein EDC04DRAFT_2732747 [Pisolithus marmoratus]|nr:hypothetical protein EDC04DRAFT_2732747 [Pisolithus marmoratus]
MQLQISGNQSAMATILLGSCVTPIHGTNLNTSSSNVHVRLTHRGTLHKAATARILPMEQKTYFELCVNVMHTIM